MESSASPFDVEIETFTKVCGFCGRIKEYKSKSGYDKSMKRGTHCIKCKNHIGANEENRNMVVKLHSQGLSDREIAAMVPFSRDMVSFYRRILGLKPNGKGRTKLDLVSDSEARCSKCSKIKPLAEFTVNRNGKRYSYHLSYCFECRKNQAVRAVNRDIATYLSYLVTRLKSKCKAREIACDLTKQQVYDIWSLQNGLCFYTDTPMVTRIGNGYNKRRVSIDRVIPGGSYTESNVVLCIQKVNTVKNDLSINELRAWIPEWHRRLVAAGKVEF
jgi:hypothetical protein